MANDLVDIERLVQATPAQVWPYFSQGDLWRKWQGAEAFIEPVEGGEFWMKMPDGATAVGVVQESVERERLVLSWGWVDGPFELEPGSTTVEITLTPKDAGTIIRLRHTSLPTDLVPPHDQGWVMCLDILVGFLDG